MSYIVYGRYSDWHKWERLGIIECTKKDRRATARRMFGEVWEMISVVEVEDDEVTHG